MLFFWVVTPCGLVGRHQLFEEKYSLHLQPSRLIQYISSNSWCLPTSPQGVATQKNNIVKNCEKQNVGFIRQTKYIEERCLLDCSAV
jgi:hypothetical protein